MKLGGKVAVGLALVVGVATSYTVYQYVNRVSQEAKPVPMAQVVTAARAIPARTVITGDMLRITQVPAVTKLPLAVADPSQVSGKVTKLPISSGEQVLTDKVFGDRVESGLAFVVPPGKRAVAVAVNEIVGSGGLIVPGDNVDVVVVFDLKAPPQGQQQPAPSASTSTTAKPSQQPEAVAQYILQNVEVMAVAQKVEGDTPVQSGGAGNLLPGKTPASPQPQQAATQPDAHTVTLAVSPDEATRLVLAEDKGRIRLVLRAHGDTANVPMPSDPLLASQTGQAVLRPDLKQS